VKAGVFPKGFDGALFRGPGCDFCAGTGLRGRIAAFEVLTMSEALRESIGKGVTIDVLRSTAQKGGFISIENYCAHLLTQGLTTPEEVLRIVGSRE
jgi:type II secretory ATPase GspE/PulE/Tfp pilus assembly ATPase PilB-like protein